jgi:E3 ubiquitin-protein ligase mind-bomb
LFENQKVGHKGKVDLKYIQEGSGGYYYKDHLPILGMNEGKNLPSETIDTTATQTNANTESPSQNSNGNSNSENTNNLNIFNPIEPNANDTQLTIKPADTLTISTSNTNSNTQSTVLNQFSVGDKVKIVLNVESFRQMQEGHGGWNHKMTEVIFFFS